MIGYSVTDLNFQGMYLGNTNSHGSVTIRDCCGGELAEVYENSELTVTQTNPVMLDIEGKANIFLKAGQYTFTMRDASGEIVKTQPNMFIGGGGLSFGTISVVQSIEEMLTIQDPQQNDTVFVQDLKRGGTFIFDVGNINVNDDGTYLNGWVRQYTGLAYVEWFGAKGDGNTDDREAVQKAIDGHRIKGIIFGSSNYAIGSTGDSIENYIVNSGDPSWDANSKKLLGVLIENKNNFEINLNGSVFNTPQACIFTVLSCKNIIFDNGDFTTKDDAGVTTNEATPIISIRSYGTKINNCSSEKYFDGFVLSESVSSSVTNCSIRNCFHTGIYSTDEMQTDIGVDDKTGNSITNNIINNSRLYNILAGNTIVSNNAIKDINATALNHIHIAINGNYTIINGNTIVDTASYNDVAIRSKGIAVLSNVSKITIADNIIDGTFIAIDLNKVSEATVTGNTTKGYYQTGISAVSYYIDPDAFNISNVSITGNTIGAMNDTSTLVSDTSYRNCGIEVVQGADSTIDNITFTSNIVTSSKGNATKIPDHNIYFTVEDGKGTIDYSNNTEDTTRDTVANSHFYHWFVNAPTVVDVTSDYTVNEAECFSGGLNINMTLSGANGVITLPTPKKGMILYVYGNVTNSDSPTSRGVDFVTSGGSFFDGNTTITAGSTTEASAKIGLVLECRYNSIWSYTKI